MRNRERRPKVVRERRRIRNPINKNNLASMEMVT